MISYSATFQMVTHASPKRNPRHNFNSLSEAQCHGSSDVSAAAARRVAALGPLDVVKGGRAAILVRRQSVSKPDQLAVSVVPLPGWQARDLLRALAGLRVRVRLGLYRRHSQSI
jgi:hypothetical protein